MNPCENQFQQEQEEAMRQYEADRESAASVSEPCCECPRPMSEICDFCSGGLCENHMLSHLCTQRQLRRML